ncbi:MAG: hypothetical protein LBH68_07750 [Bifidobacteriaceae bacterium]|jgi:hypothetical protein|nr:hypothetical protein [Bifidobacteriaceae bacterium]
MPELEVPWPPEAFSVWWLIGGLICILTAVALMTVPPLVRWIRARRQAAKQTGQVGPLASRAASWSILREIAKIERAWKSGEISDRAAAQRLSLAVRAFAGREATTMTLTDLKVHEELVALVDMVSAAYPVEFGVEGEGDIEDLAQRARAAVGR